MRELQEQGFAPPSLLVPQVPDKMNVEPQAFKAMLHAAAATVTSKADEALDASPPVMQTRRRKATLPHGSATARTMC